MHKQALLCARRKPSLYTSASALAALLISVGSAAQTTADTDAAQASPITQDKAASLSSGRQGVLSALGETLNDAGVIPILDMTQMYLTNPSFGQTTGKHEALTFISAGAIFDMKKIAGIDGATLHWQQMYVPYTSNLGWGNQAGDSLVGQAGPYVPRVSHLMFLSWEQKALNDQLDIEAGKNNAGFFFATPVCNQDYGCQSAILQKTAGFNPIIYADWGARVRYDLTPAWSVQAGGWRSNPAFPFTNGWEWGQTVPTSNTWLANVTYRTTYQNDPYPKSYELMFYHNTAEQTDPYTGEMHKGTSGMYVGGRQVVYRPDGGRSGDTTPTALSLFGSFTTSFDAHSSAGLANTGIAGLILEAPMRSRPHDSYALSLYWSTLSSNEQRYLQQQNLAAGGSGYTVGRTEYGLKLDGNFALTRSVTLNAYVTRLWNVNTWMNPAYAGTPSNGYAAGMLLKVSLDSLLGLVAH